MPVCDYLVASSVALHDIKFNAMVCVPLIPCQEIQDQMCPSRESTMPNLRKYREGGNLRPQSASDPTKRAESPSDTIGST